MPESSPNRWYHADPQTFLGTVTFFTIGFAVVQPLFQAAFVVISHDPSPFNGMRGWLLFAGLAACVGAGQGVSWYGMRRLAPGWWRLWAEMSLRSLPIAMAISVRSSVRDSPIWEWLAIMVGTSAVMGLLWAALARVWARATRSLTPARSPQL